MNSFQRLSHLEKIGLTIIPDFAVDVLQGLTHFSALKQLALTLLSPDDWFVLDETQFPEEVLRPFAQKLAYFSLHLDERVSFQGNFLQSLLRIFKGIPQSLSGVNFEVSSSPILRDSLNIYGPYLKDLRLYTGGDDRPPGSQIEVLLMFFNPQNNGLFKQIRSLSLDGLEFDFLKKYRKLGNKRIIGNIGAFEDRLTKLPLNNLMHLKFQVMPLEIMKKFFENPTLDPQYWEFSQSYFDEEFWRSFEHKKCLRKIEILLNNEQKGMKTADILHPLEALKLHPEAKEVTLGLKIVTSWLSNNEPVFDLNKVLDHLKKALFASTIKNIVLMFWGRGRKESCWTRKMLQEAFPELRTITETYDDQNYYWFVRK